MAKVETASQLAKTVGIPVERLLAQLSEAGVAVNSPDGILSEQDKLKLLGYLRRSHGKEEKSAPSQQDRAHIQESEATNEPEVQVRKEEYQSWRENEASQKNNRRSKRRKSQPKRLRSQELPTRKVFVSYSWDNQEHISWVKRFAARLRTDGIDAILDRWELHPGDPVTEFMERSITNSDFVLIICTPAYRDRANCRKGGVGYEGTIITAEVYTKANHRKFIPILRQGSWQEASPAYALAKLYIDMRDLDEDREEFGYRDLLLTILGRREAPPPLGCTPAHF